MIKKLLVICLIGFSACGGGYDVHVDPIQVNHVVSIDLNSLNKYFYNLCSQQYTQQTDINNCVNQDVTDFLNLVLAK